MENVKENPAPAVAAPVAELEKQLSTYQSPLSLALTNPHIIDNTMKLAHILAKSGVVPKEMIGKPEAVFGAISLGFELGLSPMQALSNIMVVNNRASVWGDVMKALIIAAKTRITNEAGDVIEVPLCELFDEDKPDIALKQGYGRCRTKRVGYSETETRFSIEDAKKARLWTKEGPWQNYPGRMLQMRARSWELRDNFADILKGLQAREEVEDYQILYPETTVMPRRIEETPPVIEAEPVKKPEPGDAQEPIETAPASVDTSLITEEQRKELFQLRVEAGIKLDEVKEYMAQHCRGIKSTAEMTQAEYKPFVKWIVKSAKN